MEPQLEPLVQWVKVENGKIVQGPSTYKHDDTYAEYVEVLNLTPPYTRVNVDIAMVDGKCVKTVTSIPDYRVQREAEYPPIADYLDGVVKGDQAQIDAYIAACQAVKAKYPKPAE
jgi:hypothetical protein